MRSRNGLGELKAILLGSLRLLMETTRYWAQEHDYKHTAANVRQGGFVSKIAEDEDVGVERNTDRHGEDRGPTERTMDQIADNSAQKAIPKWLDVPICVMDPFIRTKVCAIIKLREPLADVVQIVTRGVDVSWQMHFQLECFHAVESLQAGGNFYDLLNPVNVGPTPARLSPRQKKKRVKAAKIAENRSALEKTPPPASDERLALQNLPKLVSVDVVLEDPSPRNYVHPEVTEDEPEDFNLTKS